MIVKTNNVPRDLITRHDLTPEELAVNASYADGDDDTYFFRYKGEVWALEDFPRLDNGLTGDGGPWQAGLALTVFSGIVIRLVEVDGDTCVVVGYFYE